MTLCLVSMMGMAQSSLADSLSDYEARFTKLNKAYAKEPDNVENLYNMAQFYFDNSHPMRNLPMAMKYIQRAEARHIVLLEGDKLGELARLARKNITLNTIRQTKQAITDAAYNTLEVRTDMSRVELDIYLDAFGIDINMVRLLRQRRINQVYDEDLRRGTAQSYYHFIDIYPGTTEAEQMEERLARLAPTLFEGKNTEADVDSVAVQFTLSPSVQRAAEKQKSRMAYARASKRGTAAAYREFLNRYPASDESQQARERLDDLLEMDFSKRKTAMELAHFADSNSDLALADMALAKMRKLIYDNHDVEAARYYIEHFKSDSYYNEVYGKYYSWHTAEGNLAPIKKFASENPDFPYHHALEGDLDSGEDVDQIRLMDDFLEVEFGMYASNIRKTTGKGVAFVALQRCIQYYLQTRNYKAAVDRVRQFELSFDNEWKGQYRDLINLLTAAPSGRTPRQEYAATYNVIHPTVNPADGNLYFTRASGASRVICYAKRQDGEWRSAGTVAFSNTDNDGLTLFGFYAGGTHMLLGSAGDIWVAEKEGDHWRISDILPYPINTDYLETDAYMLPDGSGMLLTSDRPGGHNLQPSGSLFHGDTALATDIYYVPYVRNKWGKPINLGIKVNTLYCERSPILSRNLKTLYFVSDGHGGLGYGDIYMVTRTNLDDWTSWSKPQNIGREVNTGFREQGISFSVDEKRIYYSTNSQMGFFSCYSFPTSHETVGSYEPYAIDILGMEDFLFRVRVADLSAQSVTQMVDYSGAGTSITVNVHKDKRYAILGDAGMYFVPAIVIDPKVKSRQRLRGYTFPVLVASDKALPLQAVDFEDGSAALRPVAAMQLEQLAQFMENQPGSIVEFGIDVAGNDDTFCYNLALERGKTIRDFLVDRGIDPANVIISAYGNVNTKRQGASGVSVRFRDKM